MSGSVLLESIVTRGRVTRRDSHSAIVTSQALDWPGVRVEAGRNDVSAVDDLVGDQHYLSLNLDKAPLKLEVQESHGFKQFTVPPESLWISPSAMPITVRLNRPLGYRRVALDPLHLARLVAPSLDTVEPMRLRRTYAVQSPQIRHLMLTLRDEADSRNAGGLALVEAVTAGLGHLLLRYAGVEQPRPLRARGGLTAAAKRREIGRASCRERGEISGVAVSLKKKKKERNKIYEMEKERRILMEEEKELYMRIEGVQVKNNRNGVGQVERYRR